ncbi:DUF4142 domain-containing protein [Actinomadura meridiana]|uniref:DUF4142 domain-containing protein n=1 Tax=Actinomadura meridiana TaxID=559626 RepID=A0ABP8BUR7_9ACTN
MRTPRPTPTAACTLSAALSAALLLGGCTALGRQSTDGGAQPPGVTAENAAQSTVTTPWGPLGPADRLLITDVRRAVLWEIPLGREAARRAARPATRRALTEIARRDARLDDLTRETAARVNVALPDQPTADQHAWTSEITGKSGTEYDKTAVARLRTAQGLLYARIAAVRASTRNTLVRQFARQCATVVDGHLALLEGTGFVTGDTLPDPPAVTGAPAPGAGNRPPSPAPAATSLVS